jgi:hypothetical protein
MKRNGGVSFEETYQNITVIDKAGENITFGSGTVPQGYFALETRSVRCEFPCFNSGLSLFGMFTQNKRPAACPARFRV